jgi:YVTN family beta-propeller protein
MKLKILLPVLALIAALTTSCKDDDPEIITPPTTIGRAVFVVNEGSFGSGNSSLSMIDLLSNSIYQDVFQTVNGFPLGDVAQSMHIHNGKGYIVVNNSQKVEVINSLTLESTATITGFQSPRHFLAKGNKGYVTDWFSNRVAVVDLTSNSIVNSISVGNGPEQMIISGNRLFVTNVGGFGTDSTVSVIDLQSETVEATLITGINPNSLQTDATGKLWVLCGGTTGPDFIGGTADDIGGSLIKIDPVTLATENTFSFPQSAHPSKLQINSTGDVLYYLNGTDGYTGNIMKMNTGGTLPVQPFINRVFYGLGVDKKSGIIYGGYVPGFTSNGYVIRYNSSAVLIDSMQAGIAPNGFCFR